MNQILTMRVKRASLWDAAKKYRDSHIGNDGTMTAEDAAVYASMLDMARARQRVEAAKEEPEPTAEDEMAVEDTAYFQSRQRIAELMSGLSQQESKLLSLRFGLEGGLPLSPEETGKKLGLTPREVVEMEAAALAKLRNE